METFAKLFGSLLALVYHCFDRVVILGHLPLLTRSENIVHSFRDIHQIKTISKEVLRQPTKDYHRWVEVFAKRRKLPLEWAEKGCARKTTFALPAAHAVAPSVRCLLHPQKHGIGALLPLRRSPVSGQGSPLLHPRSTRLPLHPLFTSTFATSGGGYRSLRSV